MGLERFNTTYDTNSSFLGFSHPTDSTGFQLALNGADLDIGFQYIHLRFTDALTGVAGQTTTLDRGTHPTVPSIMVAYGGGGDNLFDDYYTIEINNFGSSVTAVPWETDALSVIGATTLFGFGVWTKRKRKVDLSK